MQRILLFIALAGFVGQAAAWYPDPDKVFAEQYQQYYASLKLNYEVPFGCQGRGDPEYKYVRQPVCQLAADFNGDGLTDYAALLEYVGGKFRYGMRYLDLVVLFSSKQGRPSFNLMRGVGTVTERGDVSTFMRLQPEGFIILPSGPKELTMPAIDLLRTDGDNEDPWSYPTVYWSERKQMFYKLTKAAD